ncbi:deoxynucleotide monophosphate kinase family protein [Kribbella deserti]|uniref:Deoxynucleoside monophosphate kinase n=1 Tax=Kribbella deserti TaxID=1926257 RepID=A0ABV6QGQ2_9ACTN
MASRIIGVLGRKRHGKDTFAARLCSEHGFTRLAFGDNLRTAVLKQDPFIVVTSDEYGVLAREGWALPYPGPYVTRLSHLVQALGWDKAKELREVRRTLQHMGMGVRDLDPDFWLRIVLDQAATVHGPVVITDVRFSNEVDAVRNHLRGSTVRIVNPRIPRPAEDHVSESALDYFTPDITVPNAGTVEDLHRHADRIACALS